MKDTHQLILVCSLAVIGVFTVIGMNLANSEQAETHYEIQLNDGVASDELLGKIIKISLHDGVSGNEVISQSELQR